MDAKFQSHGRQSESGNEATDYHTSKQLDSLKKQSQTHTPLKQTTGTLKIGGLGRCFSFFEGGIFRFQPFVFRGVQYSSDTTLGILACSAVVYLGYIVYPLLPQP